MSTDGNINSIKTFLNIFHGHILTDRNICNHIDASSQDMFDISFQNIMGQAIIRNTITQHTAQFGTLFIYRYLMTHLRQEISSSQTAGAAADDPYCLACGFMQDLSGLKFCMIHRKAFQTADIHSIIYHGTTTVRFTGVFTYISAGRRERIVLTDQFHSFFISAFIHQCHITGNIHMGRAGRNTGYGMAQGRNAAAMEYMFFIVFAETADAFQHHMGTFVTDGTACRIGNDSGCTFDGIDGFQRCFLIQHLFDQIRQLSQTNTAGNALPTGLCMTKAQITQRDIHRTQTISTGTDTTFHIYMQAIQNGLGASGRFNR